MIAVALALQLAAAPAHVVILGGGTAPDAAQPFVAAWPAQAELGVIAAGTVIERVSFIEVITRTGTAEVLSTGEKVRYVSYAAEGYHNVIDAKGGEEQVHDDDRNITDFGSGPEGWIEISAGGKHGYSQDLFALERGMPSAEHGCVR